MSGIPTVNVVDDEEMSSQGSVNAPVAPQPSSPQQARTVPVQPVWHPSEGTTIATQQSSVAQPSASVPVESTQAVVAPTIVVDAPSREETQKAFAEVSSVLQQASSAHEEVKTEMQSLATSIEELRRTQAGDVETTSQLQKSLQRTLSASSSLEMRVGQTEQQQTQVAVAAVEAKRASEEALSQASRLQEEQQKVKQEVSTVLSMQAEEAQRKIEDATKVAIQTQSDVRDISTLARQADFTAKKTAADMEMQLQQMSQRLAEQSLRMERQSQSARLEQQKLAQQLAEAQRSTQVTATSSQHSESQLMELQQKMRGLETLLIEQRQKGSRLESELSAAQDRIGGAERRAQRLEEENFKIHSELQSWHDWYNEDTGAEQQASAEISYPVSQPIVTTSTVGLVAQPEPAFGEMSGTAMAISTPMSAPALSSPHLRIGNVGRFDAAGNFHRYDNAQPEGTIAQQRVPPFSSQQSGRRDSFGSVFPGSSGTGGNGNGTGNGSGIAGNTQHTGPTQTATFNIGIKPKEPPVFHGRANEDVDTWLAKVGDFMYLTEANDRQQVAYMATLLQDAAADWWASLLKERHGVRPLDFFEMTNLLQRRFGSTTRVDRARAELRNIKQGQSEGVRSYSTRFEGLLAKLPTFDQEWAKSQFVWGLHQRVAELVVISNPRTLREAINQAENIEMARSQVAAGHQQQGQRTSGPWRGGRGGFSRGRSKFGAIQGGPNNHPQIAAVQNANMNQSELAKNQCAQCKGYGHWAYQCPSYRRGFRGSRGRMTRGRGMRGQRGGRSGGRRGGRNAGNGGTTSTHAALTTSESGTSGSQLQQAQDAAPVPVPRPGN